MAGIPDFILCVNGMFVALELKRSDKKKATKLQGHILGLINEAGGLGVVLHPENFESVFMALKALSKGESYDRTNLGSA